MADKNPPRRASNAPAKPGTGAKGPLAKGESSGPPAAAGTPPGLQWKALGYVGGAVAILWAVAFAAGSKIVAGLVAVITVLVIAALAYAWNWSRKQRKMIEILQGASASPEARREALAKLQAQSGGDNDVMNAFARAQLEAQENPERAIVTLEGIDLNKAPGPLADQIRATRGQLYLLMGRPRDARVLADEIKVSSAGEPEARGMFAAVVAEAWARTGKHKEALDLLETIKPDDAEYGTARVPLLFARVYASFAAGQREQVRRDFNALMKEDVNYLARFVMPKAKVHPELQKIAKDALARNPEVRKMAQKQSRAQRRGR